VARKPRQPPLSIRLPTPERDDLKARAKRAGLSVSGYFRTVAFNTPRQSRRPSVNEQELARLVSAMGKIGSNVNQLARVANAGSWPDSRAINDACADIRWIRDTLMLALGVTPPPGPTAPAGP
jgi:Bacterial mobilisation protein (MobC)